MAKDEKESKQEVQKVEPTRALSPFEEMERMFDNYFSRGWMRPSHFDWPSFPGTKAFEGKTPSVDVIDRDDEIIVKAELPGVDKKDIEVSVTNNTVTIKGTTSHEEKEEKGDYYRCEISRGSYSRTLSLPADVDEDNTRAKVRDGILELTLPKLKKSRRRNIKVE
ncbi:MAG: Hsp20/alpha crystallin family protein [Gammaproteobacteria bacterium]|jgi:HSP20 family protein